jgi:hypothetical protein
MYVHKKTDSLIFSQTHLVTLFATCTRFNREKAAGLLPSESTRIEKLEVL